MGWLNKRRKKQVAYAVVRAFAASSFPVGYKCAGWLRTRLSTNARTSHLPCTSDCLVPPLLPKHPKAQIAPGLQFPGTSHLLLHHSELIMRVRQRSRLLNIMANTDTQCSRHKNERSGIPYIQDLTRHHLQIQLAGD